MALTKSKRDKIADLLGWLAIPGMVVFFGVAACSIYIFRTSPMSPDALHTVEYVEHGRHLYLTPLQANLCSPVLAFIGLAECFLFGILAIFLGNDCKFNPGIFSRKKP